MIQLAIYRPIDRRFGRFRLNHSHKERVHYLNCNERFTFKNIRPTFWNKISTVIATPYKAIEIGLADLAAVMQTKDTWLCVSGQESCVTHKCIIYRNR